MAFTDATTSSDSSQNEADWLSAMRSKTSSMRSETLSRQKQTDSLLRQASELRAQNEQLAKQNSDFFKSLLGSCPQLNRSEQTAAVAKDAHAQAEASPSLAPPSLLMPKRGRLQQPRYGQLRQMTAD